jgi:hypothetical protein
MTQSHPETQRLLVSAARAKSAPLLLSACTALLTLPLTPKAHADPPAATFQLTDADLAFIKTIGTHRYWVSALPVTTRSLSSPPKPIRSGIAFARLATKTLPAQLQPLAGATVHVHTATPTNPCNAALRNWGILAEYDPNPESDEDTPAADIPEAQRAAQAFAPETTATLRYAVDITTATRSCNRAVWARLASLPEITEYAVTALEGKALDHERPRMRKADSYRAAQRRFAAEHGKGPWDRAEDTDVSAFATTLAGTRFTVASLRHFDWQGFSEDLSLFFRGTGPTSEVLSNDLIESFSPSIALDLNADGIPKWLSDAQLVGWNGKTFGMILDVRTGDYGCAC